MDSLVWVEMTVQQAMLAYGNSANARSVGGGAAGG